MSLKFPLTYTIEGSFFPAFPGAWLVSNNGISGTADNISLPVYTSIRHFSALSDTITDPSYVILGINETIDDVIVLPGFKVVSYNFLDFSGNGTNIVTCNNIDGKNIKVFSLQGAMNTMTSLQLYFKDVEIPEPE